MSFRNQIYSADKMSRHLDYLKMYEEEGEPLDFEILIDGMRAIRRTNNSNRFSLYENFINEDTQKVELLIYQGSSNHNDKYTYYLKEEPGPKETSLGEIDERIEERVREAERKWKSDQLEKRNQELTEEVEELEAEIEKLEKEMQQLQDGQSPLKGILGEVGAGFVESFLRNNPQIAMKIPGGQALAGLLEKEDTAPTEESEISFAKAAPQKSLSTEEEQLLIFAKELKEAFREEEFAMVVEILQHMARDKSQLTSTYKHLSKRNNGKAQI
jgi:hypothetical protein